MNNRDKQRPPGQSGELDRFEQRMSETPEMQSLHQAVLREQFSPSEGEERVPVLLFIGILALVMWGGWYLSEYDASFDSAQYDGPAAFVPASPASGGERAPVAIDPMTMGKRIYANCISCHQADGQGVTGQFPPLAGSRWVLGNPDVLARILVGGLQGPVEVRGQVYNAQMPAWDHLRDVEIAAVLTYIRASWGNNALPIDSGTIERARADERSAPWTAEALDALRDGQ